MTGRWITSRQHVRSPRILDSAKWWSQSIPDLKGNGGPRLLSWNLTRKPKLARLIVGMHAYGSLDARSLV